MDCRDFRRLHGAWVADELPRRQQDLATMHVAQCDQCSRFDAFTRRALMVARSAEPLQVSADFSQKLAARLAAERAAMAADPAARATRGLHASHADRVGRPTTTGFDRLDVPEHGLAWLGSVSMDWRARTPLARAAAIFALVIGTSGALLATRSGSTGAGTAASVAQAGMARTGARPVAAPAATNGALVVVQKVHPVDGFILDAHDPLQPVGDDALAATAVSAAAPLWPTARMASSAAGRFAAMEFGDVRPVPVSLRR